jgi:signal peptide peptidase SppA
MATEPQAGTNTAASPSSGTAIGGHGPVDAQRKPGLFARRFPSIHARYTQAASSRVGRSTSYVWQRRRPIFIGLAVTYGVVNYLALRYQANKRDTIKPESWLVLKVHPGSIVECRSTTSLAQQLLHKPSPGEEPPRIMELFELCQALRWAANDDRVRGIFADFSGLHIPGAVTPSGLGAAQIEELVEALHEFRILKKDQRRLKLVASKITEALEDCKGKDTFKEAQMIEARMKNGETFEQVIGVASADDEQPSSQKPLAGEETSLEQQVMALEKADEVASKAKLPVDSKLVKILRDMHNEFNDKPTSEDGPVTIAWADTFSSQGAYLLASAFDQVYVQRSGDVPLTGVGMQIPFYKRILNRFGITVHAEARKEFKSVVAPYLQEDGLTAAQLQDEAQLLGELSRSISYSIGVNRFPNLPAEEAADKVASLLARGPFSALEAADLGLIDGVKYKRDVIKELGEEPELRSFSSYHRVVNTTLSRNLSDKQRPKVAVVYLMGGISNAPGEFSASQCIAGLREAAEDEDISSIVLRIDSGGGSALTSDSIWDAVKRVQEETGKPIVASFGNASASGGYYAAASADHIMACETTITGSIGVAAIRPTITKKLFDMLDLRVQSIFSGSNSQSLLHDMTDEEKARFARHTDETYDQFLDKVCSGRKISSEVIGELAGGRVWTGLAAWIRCNPDKELVEEKDGSSEKEQGGVKVINAVGGGKLPTKAISLTSDWKVVDATKEGEMSMMRIESVPPSPRNSAQNDDDDSSTRIAEKVREVATKVEEQLHIGAEAVGKDKEHGNEVELDEESKLAVSAHEEAMATQKDNGEKDAVVGIESEVKLGPYGRGLIDSIGGVWDAAHKAYTMGVEREIATYIKEGKTAEEAFTTVMQDLEVVQADDGTPGFSMDLNLVRYPKEKTFRERIREINRKGDQPTLSTFLPGVTGLGVHLRDYMTEAAVQMLVKVWSDPAFVHKVASALEQEQGIRLERNTNVQI